MLPVLQRLGVAYAIYTAFHKRPKLTDLNNFLVLLNPEKILRDVL